MDEMEEHDPTECEAVGCVKHKTPGEVDEFRTGDGDLIMKRPVPPGEYYVVKGTVPEAVLNDPPFPEGRTIGKDPEGVPDPEYRIAKLESALTLAQNSRNHWKGLYFKWAYGSPTGRLPAPRPLDEVHTEAEIQAVRRMMLLREEILNEAERRVREYMTGHFSEATIGGVVQAVKGEGTPPPLGPYAGRSIEELDAIMKSEEYLRPQRDRGVEQRRAPMPSKPAPY